MSRTADDTLVQRVAAEFLEMPGLRLTCAQAERLWGLEPSTCLQVLEYLVDTKFLYQPARGIYTRLTDGYAARPRRRPVDTRSTDDTTNKQKDAV